MITAWLSEALALCVGIAVIYLPGLAVAAALRLRGLALVALAPAASVLLYSVWAVVLPFFGLPWDVWTIAASVGATAGIMWLLCWRLGPAVPSSNTGPRIALLAGLITGAVIGSLRVLLYVGEPASISQSNDAVFHLNALQWVLDSGSASSMNLTGVVGASGFYPGGWHAVVSALVLFSGAEIPVAVNIVTLLTAVLIWPVGLAWLVQQVTRSRVVAGAAAALSGALLTFPMLMIQWGVLYPYLLSVALLPVAIALVVSVPEWVRGRGPVANGTKGAILAGIALAGVLGAIAFAQPATLLAWLIAALAFSAAWAAPRAWRARSARRWVLLGGLLGVALIAGLIWFTLSRSTTGAHWPPFRSRPSAVVDVLLNGQVMLPFAIAVSVLAVIGLVVAVKQTSLRWLVLTWAAFAGLYVLVASVGNPWLRQWALGAWYADPYRIAALAPVVVIPLASIGLVAIVGLAARALNRDSWVAGVSVGIAAVVAAIGVLIAPVVLMPKVFENEWDDESRYEINDESWLSSDERVLLERLSESVSPDTRVIGNPSTGSGFGYVLGGVDVFPRTWSHPRTDTWVTIQNGLRDVANSPDVCAALDAYGGSEYVLDFGEGEATPGRFVLPGMSGFQGQPGFELIDREGAASLWRVTACD